MTSDDGSGARLRRVYGVRLLAEPSVQRAVLVLLLVVVLLFRLAQFLVYSTQIQWGYDFSAYLTAAQNVLDGLPIYSAEQLAGPYSPQQQFLYLYPPFFAVAMTPFAIAFEDYRVANWLWAGVGALIVVAIVWAVDRREGITSGRGRLLLLGAAFAFPPLVGELVMGNVHLLVLGLVGGAWLLLSDPRGGRPREAAAGVLLGIAILIKLFPVVIVLWLVLRRRWFVAGATGAAIVGLGLATLPFVGLQPWLDYPTVLLNLGAPSDTNDTIAPAVWLGTVLSPMVARVLVASVGVGILVWSARNRAEPASYAIAVCVSVLIAPALYHHYLAILVLPMLLALRWAPPIWWLAAAYVLMWGGEQEALGGVVWVVNRVLPTVGAVLLLGGLMRQGAAPRTGRLETMTVP